MFRPLSVSLAISSAMVLSAQAHFIWIETPAVQRPGADAEARVYFGEYDENRIETEDTRLREREAATLQIVTDEGAQSPVRLKMKNDHYAGPFVVPAAGVVDLVAEEVESPVVDYTNSGIGVVRPTFYARTRFLSFDERRVAKGAWGAEPVTTLDIIPITVHLDSRRGRFGPAAEDEVVFQVYFKGDPVDATPDTLNVYGPNGWIWKAVVDQRGVARFKPLWPGLYIVDAIVMERTPGTFKGTAYEAIRHRATLSINVRE